MAFLKSSSSSSSWQFTCLASCSLILRARANCSSSVISRDKKAKQQRWHEACLRGHLGPPFLGPAPAHSRWPNPLPGPEQLVPDANQPLCAWLLPDPKLSSARASRVMLAQAPRINSLMAASNNPDHALSIRASPRGSHHPLDGSMRSQPCPARVSAWRHHSTICVRVMGLPDRLELALSAPELLPWTTPICCFI